ncbi:MAG: class I SAM-dependent methyltransferase [Actinobacteria bacterium]|nr:class I SAM-dependent methyltransferase [Actinomycetota bacterium]
MAKITFFPLKYRHERGYDAEAYWKDRFLKHGMSFRGVGNEGFDETRNRLEYERSLREFQSALLQAGVDFAGKKVMEIGVGNGFYLNFCAKDSAYYCAVDITDALFAELSRRYPEVHFIKADVCNLNLDEKFDIIIMIDVIEHIVNENDLASAMANVKNCLAPNGVFILGPVHKRTTKHLFYVHFWSLDVITKFFQDYHIEVARPFREGALLFIRRR